MLALEGPQRNLARNLQGLYQLLPHRPSPLAEDLADIATAIYAADLGLPRGRNEDWVRTVELLVPVRDPEFWTAQAEELSYLLYVLTRDSFRFDFAQGRMADPPEAGLEPVAADCVSLLSGGVDSLAGAVMLLRTGRRPLLVCHQSGNPTVGSAQTQVAAMLEALEPAASAVGNVRLQAEALRSAPSDSDTPVTGEREPSQRSRAFLFMALALAAGDALGVEEAYIPENGILTIAVPLAPSRIGGMSTRSTHPKVLTLMNRLAERAGLACALSNPFIYHTKAEIVGQILRPVLSPFEVQRTVSCWAAGRTSRQCGGCVPCLVRRLAMLAADLPDEAYGLDVLGRPQDYLGTDAYGNLVDLLGLCGDYLALSDVDLLRRSPELIDCAASGVSLTETVALYRRFAEEVCQVVRTHFPTAAPLIS